MFKELKLQYAAAQKKQNKKQKETPGPTQFDEGAYTAIGMLVFCCTKNRVTGQRHKKTMFGSLVLIEQLLHYSSSNIVLECQKVKDHVEHPCVGISIAHFLLDLLLQVPIASFCIDIVRVSLCRLFFTCEARY